MKARVVFRAKIKWWKVLLSGAIFAVIAQIIHSIGAYLAMNYYLNPAYSPLWSPLMTSMQPGSYLNNFIYVALIFSFITGLIFAFFYALLRAVVPGKDFVSKGLCYGLSFFFISTVPGYLSLYLLINLPAMLILYWAVESFIIFLINGLVVARINK